LLNQLNCPNCGAALPLPASLTEVVTCQYCHTTFRIPKTVTPEPDLGDLMLGADFSQKPIAGWDFPNEANIQIIKGNPPELRAKFTPVDSLEYVLNSSGFFDDVDASVSIKFYDGDLKYIDAGLVLRYRKGIGSYCVLISAQGTYAIFYYEKGDETGMFAKTFMDWTKHTALRAGLNQVNRLRVVVYGDHLRIYLNGVLATTLHDTRFDDGEVILATEGTIKSSIEVGFFDMQLREVKKS